MSKDFFEAAFGQKPTEPEDPFLAIEKTFVPGNNDELTQEIALEFLDHHFRGHSFTLNDVKLKIADALMHVEGQAIDPSLFAKADERFIPRFNELVALGDIGSETKDGTTTYYFKGEA